MGHLQYSMDINDVSFIHDPPPNETWDIFNKARKTLQDLQYSNDKPRFPPPEWNMRHLQYSTFFAISNDPYFVNF